MHIYIYIKNVISLMEYMKKWFFLNVLKDWNLNLSGVLKKSRAFFSSITSILGRSEPKINYSTHPNKYIHDTKYFGWHNLRSNY